MRETIPLKRTLCLCFALFAIVSAMTACSYQQPGVYRGYELAKEGPLSISRHYEFRFVNRWRISFDWLNGPVEIDPCKLGGADVFTNSEGTRYLKNTKYWREKKIPRFLRLTGFCTLQR